MSMVLSLFTGAGLLDRGFEHMGYCVVSAGDILWGRDVRSFAPARHTFEGIIGGSPCQEFSKSFRGVPSGYGVEMINQFARCVTEAAPDWFLLENVPGVPDLIVPGYTVQRFNLNAKECGVEQNRLRCFQFGSLDGMPLVIQRPAKSPAASRCCMATEGKSKERRNFSEFCRLMGLPADFSLPGLSQALKYRLVGNGVPVPMSRVIAGAILARRDTAWQSVCICQCGRPVRPGQRMATATCRKRMQRRRDKLALKKSSGVTQ